jgi:hypothetical protein
MKLIIWAVSAYGMVNSKAMKPDAVWSASKGQGGRKADGSCIGLGRGKTPKGWSSWPNMGYWTLIVV